MEVEKIVAGVYAANCYLVYEDTKGFIIDPGGHPEKIIDRVKALGFTPEFILLTHGHCDHIAGAEALRDYFNIPILVSEEDAQMVNDRNLSLASLMPSADVKFEADKTFKGGDILYPETFGIEVIHTPGHTAGCCCFLAGENLFTGDTLFQGNIGRTDLATADPQAMEKSLELLKKLDDSLLVYPGHGASSTMKIEKETNPYLN